jgi:galactose-1-phosphate uridylyltransferase
MDASHGNPKEAAVSNMQDPGGWFSMRTICARLGSPSRELTQRDIQIRTNPITGRTSRITFSRAEEKEAGATRLPPPPPDAGRTADCPFCRPQVWDLTPTLIPQIHPQGRMARGASLLFPNLFPYGAYSAVSLIDDNHFVEIGRAPARGYADSLINCADYLRRVIRYDRSAAYVAITQNHLPSAGGSLVHPHLQVHADAHGSNHHRFLEERTRLYHRQSHRGLLGDHVGHERRVRERMIGHTGPWCWLAAFAPEGFFEVWAVYSGQTSIRAVTDAEWHHLARGVTRVQRLYRHLNRNGYNFGLLAVEKPSSRLELRAVMVVRSNYDAWVRSDHTGFEVMLGDMATFNAPEETARLARPIWSRQDPSA